MMTLWQATNLYKTSLALFCLEQEGVLALLAQRPRRPAELAEERGLSPTALTVLVELLVEAGVLGRDGDAVVLPAEQGPLLPLVGLERRMAFSRIGLSALSEALHGRPLGDPMTAPGAEDLWPAYVAAMQVGARSLAPHLVRAARPRPGMRVLDLGGSDGSLGFAVGRLVPDLDVTVMDRPVMADAFARRQAEEQGPLTRARFLAGDLRDPSSFAAPLASADLTVASNVMHLLGAEERQALLRALRQGGKRGASLLVYDQFVSPGAWDAARGLVLDWLLCGYRFDESETQFADQVRSLGFSEVSCRRFSGLPGAFVLARL